MCEYEKHFRTLFLLWFCLNSSVCSVRAYRRVSSGVVAVVEAARAGVAVDCQFQFLRQEESVQEAERRCAYATILQRTELRFFVFLYFAVVLMRA